MIDLTIEIDSFIKVCFQIVVVLLMLKCATSCIAAIRITMRVE